MNLHAESLSALDWSVVVDALAERARTALGGRRARALAPLREIAAVRRAHDEIDELAALADDGVDPPIGAVEDIAQDAVRAAKGELLSGPELRRAGITLGALRDLAWFFATNDERCPRLAERAAAIVIDDVVADDLLVAFESDGQLSARTYPELAELRRRIAELHASVRETLHGLLRDPDMRELLQDDFVTQRNDRYVLPIKSHAKRWDLGIVHGTSGSGQTVYVEPRQVVELNNRLRLAESELEQAERRILIALTAGLGSCRDAVIEALAAVADLDLAVARRALATALGAVRPRVGDEGVLDVRGARHPILVLRGLDVVGNDLAVSPQRPALVLSGPNAGGKTISLKTIGLFALLVQHGCFVPAIDGGRVDLFSSIHAAIGDAQSVQGDLSSFSGHLLVIAEMIARAAPGHLILLDEIASGTDPGQGAALAQAVLERLIGAGPRVVVTTHFARLKALSASDPRFASAAVEYADGRPTYRVLPGALGQSHALSIAERMGLEPSVLDRARALMDEGERDLADLLQALDRARADAEVARAEANAQAARLATREAEVARREHDLRTRAQALRDEAAAGFRERLGAAERAIGAVVADLQRDPSHARVRAARASLAALSALAPAAPPDPAPPPTVSVGDRVVLKNLGGEGQVVAISGDHAQVRAGAVTVRIALDQLAPASRAAPAAPARPKRVPPAPPASLDRAVRLPSNTLDLRGQRVDEGLEAADRFLDRALRGGHDVVFLLHGHGTGAMKQALRQWLPTHSTVRSWAPAAEDQGGDAFTVAHLDPG
jgi:DNA mismatch repair protein MutS2